MMTRYVNFIAIVICMLTISACKKTEVYTDKETQIEFYVIIPLSKSSMAEKFTNTLSEILKKRSIKFNLGFSSDSGRDINYLIESNHNGVRIFGSNMLLSGKEDNNKCGHYKGPHSDPGQYYIRLESDSPKVGKSPVLRLANEIQSDLTGLGYIVSKSAVECSPLQQYIVRNLELT